MEYIFISHTGFGGIAYAMAMTCLRLQAEQQLASLSVSSSKGTDNSSPQFLANNRMVHRPANDMEAFRQGDYRDILSLTRVLASGPASKTEVDVVIDRFVIHLLLGLLQPINVDERPLGSASGSEIAIVHELLRQDLFS